MDILVSIITPLYNSQEYIGRTIESVQRQSHVHWELLIVNDCSTDNGVAVVQRYMEQDSRIKLFHNKVNSGPAVTRNSAIEIAQGSYIAFLDSDDQWNEKKLEVQLNYMEERKSPFTFTYYDHVDEKGETIQVSDKLPERVDYISTMKSNKIGCLTAMYDVRHFGKIFMEDIKKRQDYTLWLKLLKKVDYAYCVPQVLATYTVRQGSVSSNKWSLIKYHWHVYYKIEKQSFFKSLYFLSHYIACRIFKK